MPLSGEAGAVLRDDFRPGLSPVVAQNLLLSVARRLEVLPLQEVVEGGPSGDHLGSDDCMAHEAISEGLAL